MHPAEAEQLRASASPGSQLALPADRREGNAVGNAGPARGLPRALRSPSVLSTPVLRGFGWRNMPPSPQKSVTVLILQILESSG